MLVTAPTKIDFLTDPDHFVYGDRIRNLLLAPFDPLLLKKRVLRKSKDKKKAEMAHYIDLRDMAERLDLIVGPRNWQQTINITSASDRIIAVAHLTIGSVTRCGESEELLNGERWNYDKQEVETRVNELAALRAGPNATKRAAVLHGLGAYLYKFKDVNTWEEIDNYGYPKNPNINVSGLPYWAVPEAPANMVLRETLILMGKIPSEDLREVPKEEINEALEFIQTKFGLDGNKLKSLNHNQSIALTAVIARSVDVGMSTDDDF